MAMWLTQPLTEMSIRNFPAGGNERPARKADILTAIVSPFSRKCRILDISQPYRHPRTVTRVALSLFFTCSNNLE
jgi:hypothetical protein